jgi:excisionase family DNA binding protein
MTEPFVGAAEVAAHLNQSVLIIQSWARIGKIPGIKPGRAWMFRLSEVDAAVKKEGNPWAQSAQSRGRKRTPPRST